MVQTLPVRFEDQPLDRALGQLGAVEQLRTARPAESDPSVIEEIDWALDHSTADV